MSQTDTTYLQYTFLIKNLHTEFINNSQLKTKEINSLKQVSNLTIQQKRNMNIKLIHEARFKIMYIKKVQNKTTKKY